MAKSDESRGGGLLGVLGATAVAGASGYLIQLLAARLLPEAGDYLSFSVFWSTLYLIGSAVGGIQQEVARASRPVAAEGQAATLGGFTAVAALLVAVISVVAAVLVAPVAFAGSTVGMAGALAAGLVGYVATSVLTGLLYGLQHLDTVAVLITIDAVLRAVLVVVALAAGSPPDVVALAIALPFGLATGLVWLRVRRRVSGRYELDVPPRTLARGAAHTILAAAATGLMVTGMPLLFRLALDDATVTAVAGLTLVVTLTRAPFIIPLMALQSYLTVAYRDDAARATARMWRYLAVAAVVAVVAGIAAWFTVPWLIGFISGGQYSTTPFSAAIVVVGAVLVGCLCVTGPALLARSRHRAYAAGWVVAALMTLLLLFVLPLDAQGRALCALVVAPAAGLVVHLAALRRASAYAKARAESAPDGEQPR